MMPGKRGLGFVQIKGLALLGPNNGQSKKYFDKSEKSSSHKLPAGMH